MPGFEILLYYNNKHSELKNEGTTWVPTDWADYIDPDAMTTLLGDAIYNIKEEEYWEARQHTLKSPYELRANDEDEEGEHPLVMMKKEVMPRVIVVVKVDIVTMIATTIVRATTMKTMIANTMAMIGVNPLVIEKMKMQSFTMKNMMMM